MPTISEYDIHRIHNLETLFDHLLLAWMELN